MTTEKDTSLDLAAWPALADPIHDSQRCFRQVLGALSEPGKRQTLTPFQGSPPHLGVALWGTLLALCDLETRVWIGADLDSASLRQALTFHTGARLVDDPALADFALLTPESFDPATPFAMGSDIYPDRSTTLLVVVETLVNQLGWRLSGPGIAESRDLNIGDSAGCQALMKRLGANRASFPCGIDAIFGAGDQLAAIPRSTRIAGGPSRPTAATEVN
ncbi:phosphonate C-P lyase system protein PhnH [Salinicola halimionae]|uniref:phosphonate C-P lyase system protein PhnH n=1 Tax=Salinicola halimionae TaxID=1949081 RepID=UPI000DA1A36A|nr:phosphonate C-P lyase system protein PhnH [Salinicola halimionae]